MPAPLSRLFDAFGTDEDEDDPSEDTHPTAVADHEAAVERDRY